MKVRYSNRNPKFLAIISTASFLLAAAPGCQAETEFDLIHFDTSDGGKIEASLFRAQGSRAVVLAHGGVFNKESWYALAEDLQAAGVTALPIDFRGYGNSKPDNRKNLHLDVVGAIDYLESQGFKDIAVLGGSMGGEATLRALAATKSGAVTKAVLLAAAGGDAIQSAAIDKLFIVSQGDRHFPTTQRLHEASNDPKQLKIYDGDAHAQHLFKTEYAEDLTQLIVDFLAKD